eukprot:7896515-Alexandrium_andersonii.AAC.1
MAWGGASAPPPGMICPAPPACAEGARQRKAAVAEVPPPAPDRLVSAVSRTAAWGASGARQRRQTWGVWGRLSLIHI